MEFWAVKKHDVHAKYMWFWLLCGKQTIREGGEIRETVLVTIRMIRNRWIGGVFVKCTFADGLNGNGVDWKYVFLVVQPPDDNDWSKVVFHYGSVTNHPKMYLCEKIIIPWVRNFNRTQQWWLDPLHNV